ncbi:MAG TPA: helix-turn-helix transcriptional regulator, partial [Pseudonocardiaceae bacterium]|nr:helix-turn-helix transcriptional regulator [Pseudonocardiaceae bacterium]
MAERGDPSALRWLIGVELANYRNRVRRSQAEAAKAIGVSSGLVAHWEKGKYFAPPEHIAALLAYYGAPHYEAERLASLAGKADQRSWLARWDDVVPNWLRTFVGLEGLAAHEVIYAPMVLPALVQTEEYSYGTVSSSARVRPDQEERLVSLRMDRQLRLSDAENPLRLTAFIEESVLDRPIGGTEVMRAQLEHLVVLSKHDNVELLVLPTAIGRHDAVASRFLVLHFEQAQSIGYIEYLDGSVYVQDQDQVAAYTRTAEALRSVALSPAKSLA